jgi:hypothetical protein
VSLVSGSAAAFPNEIIGHSQLLTTRSLVQRNENAFELSMQFSLDKTARSKAQADAFATVETAFSAT